MWNFLRWSSDGHSDWGKKWSIRSRPVDYDVLVIVMHLYCLRNYVFVPQIMEYTAQNVSYCLSEC